MLSSTSSFEGDDEMESFAQRWQASEELSALLDICFAKKLTGFYKRQSYGYVFVPILIAFIPLHLTYFYQILSTNVNLRIMQDLLLDVTGPISMSYEMVLQAKENARQLDHSPILSCLTKSMQLLGNVNEPIPSKRRTLVLTKNGQKYTSLAHSLNSD